MKSELILITLAAIAVGPIAGSRASGRHHARREGGAGLARFRRPATRVKITEEYATHIARDAYFWGWPLVNVYNKRLAAAKTTQLAYAGPVPAAPLNEVVYDAGAAGSSFLLGRRQPEKGPRRPDLPWRNSAGLKKMFGT